MLRNFKLISSLRVTACDSLCGAGVRRWLRKLLLCGGCLALLAVVVVLVVSVVIVAAFLVYWFAFRLENEVSDDKVLQLYLGSDAVHVIIVPYRNRAEQLEQLLFYLEVFLTQFPEDQFRVYVVEQDDEDDCFNRGFLFNAGFLEAAKREEQLGCVVLHDIDRLPLGEVDYTRCSFPVHLANEQEERHWGLPYRDHCGGVVIAAAHHVREFNGMSNDYHGWGREDDDLCIRMKRVTPIARPQRGHGRYYHLKTNHTQRIRCQMEDPSIQSYHLLMGMREGSDRWKRDGLNSIAYRVTQTSTLVEGFAYLYKVAPLSATQLSKKYSVN